MSSTKLKRKKEDARFARAVLLETKDTKGIARTDHEEWVIRHLYQPLCPATLKSQHFRIINIDTEDGFDWSRTYRRGQALDKDPDLRYLLQRYRFTKKTIFYTIRRKYKVVFVIDGSPSMYTVGLPSGILLIEQAFTAFKRCLKGLLQSPPWDKPLIYVSFVVVNSEGQVPPNDLLQPEHAHHLGHDMLVTELRPDTIQYILQSAYDIIRQHVAAQPASSAPPSEPTVPSKLSRHDTQVTVQLDVADYRLGLMPVECSPVLVLITDSAMRSNTGLDQLAFLTSALNRIDTKCLVIQVGSGLGTNPEANFGHLPDNKTARFLAASMDGSFLYADDCEDIPWNALSNTTPGSPLLGPNMYHVCILIKETQLVPYGSNMSYYSIVNRGEPRLLDEPCERYNRLATHHFDVSRWFDKYPWNPHSRPPVVDITRTRWRDYFLPVPLYMILENRLREGFCLRHVALVPLTGVSHNPGQKGLSISLEMVYYPNVAIQYQITPIDSFERTIKGRHYRQYKIDIDIKPFSTFSIVLARQNDEEDFRTHVLRRKIACLEEFLERVTQRDGMLRTLSGIRPYYHGALTAETSPNHAASSSASVQLQSQRLSEVPTPEQVLKLLGDHWDVEWRDMVYFAKRQFNFAVAFAPSDCHGATPFPEPSVLETRAQAKLLEFQQFILHNWRATSIGNQSFVSFWPEKYSREEPSVNFCVHEWCFAANWVVYVDVFFYNLSFDGRRQILADFPNRVTQFQSKCQAKDSITLIRRPMMYTPFALEDLSAAFAPQHLPLFRSTAEASGAWLYRVWQLRSVAYPWRSAREPNLLTDDQTTEVERTTPDQSHKHDLVDPLLLQRLYHMMYAECLGQDLLLVRHRPHSMVFYQDYSLTANHSRGNMRQHMFELNLDERRIVESEWHEPYDFDQATQALEPQAFVAAIQRGLSAAFMSFHTALNPGLCFIHQTGTVPPTTRHALRDQYFSLASLLPLNTLHVVGLRLLSSSHSWTLPSALRLMTIDTSAPVGGGTETGWVFDSNDTRAYVDHYAPLALGPHSKAKLALVPLLHGFLFEDAQSDLFATIFYFWISHHDPAMYLAFSTKLFFEEIMVGLSDGVVVTAPGSSFHSVLPTILDSATATIPTRQQFYRFALPDPRLDTVANVWFIHRVPGSQRVLFASHQGLSLQPHQHAAPVGAQDQGDTTCLPVASFDSWSDNDLSLNTLFQPTTEALPMPVPHALEVGDGAEPIILESDEATSPMASADPAVDLDSMITLLEAHEDHLAAEGLVQFYRGQGTFRTRTLTATTLPCHPYAVVDYAWATQYACSIPTNQPMSMSAQGFLHRIGFAHHNAYLRAVYSALLWGRPLPGVELDTILPHFETYSVDINITSYLKAQLFRIHNDGQENRAHAGIRQEFADGLQVNFEEFPSATHAHVFLYRPDRFVQMQTRLCALMTEGKPSVKALNEAFDVFMECAQSPLLVGLQCTFRRRRTASDYDEITVPIQSFPTSFRFTHQGQVYDWTPSDPTQSFQCTEDEDVQVVLHFRCMVLTQTPPDQSPNAQFSSSMTLRDPLSGEAELSRFQDKLHRYLPNSQCEDISAIIRNTQQLMNREILNGLMYCQEITFSILDILQANIRQRRLWDPIGTEYVREYGLQFVRSDRDRMPLFVDELLTMDISPYRFVRLNKIVYVEKQAEPCPPDATPVASQRYCKRPFWLLLTSNSRDLTRLCYGPESTEDLHQVTSILNPVISEINFRTNQLLLLRRLANDGRCDPLLLPSPPEASPSGGEAPVRVSPDITSVSLTSRGSAGAISDSESESESDHSEPMTVSGSDASQGDTSPLSHPFFMDLMKARDYKPGEFQCQCVYSTQFDIHPRLKEQVAFKKIKERFASLQPHRQGHMFLITRQDPVYFALIEEREGSVGVPDASPLSSDATPVHAPNMTRRHTEGTPPSVLSMPSRELSPLCFPLQRPQVLLPKRQLCIEVFGIRTPVSDDVPKFVQAVKQCLDTKVVLPMLMQYLRSSHEVTQEDVDFLTRSDQTTFQQHRLNLHPLLHDPYLLLLYYRQCLLDLLQPMVGECLRSTLRAHHTRLASLRASSLDQLTSIPLDEFLFFYNGAAPAGSRSGPRLGSGVLTVHLALVHPDGQLVKDCRPLYCPAPGTWDTMVADLDHFELAAEKPPSAASHLQITLDLWMAGSVDATKALDVLMHLFHQAVGDFLVEMAMRLDATEGRCLNLSAALSPSSAGDTVGSPLILSSRGWRLLDYLSALPYGRSVTVAHPTFPLTPSLVHHTLEELAEILNPLGGYVVFKAFEHDPPTAHNPEPMLNEYLLDDPQQRYGVAGILTYLKTHLLMAWSVPDWPNDSELASVDEPQVAALNKRVPLLPALEALPGSYDPPRPTPLGPRDYRRSGSHNFYAEQSMSVGDLRRLPTRYSADSRVGAASPRPSPYKSWAAGYSLDEGPELSDDNHSRPTSVATAPSRHLTRVSSGVETGGEGPPPMVYASDGRRQTVTRLLRPILRSYLLVLRIAQGQAKFYFYNVPDQPRQGMLRQLERLQQEQGDRRRLLKSLTLFKLGLGHIAMVDADGMAPDRPLAVQSTRLLPGNPQHIPSYLFAPSILAAINGYLPHQGGEYGQVQAIQLNKELLEPDERARWQTPFDFFVDRSIPQEPYYPQDHLLRAGGQMLDAVAFNYLETEQKRREENMMAMTQQTRAQNEGPITVPEDWVSLFGFNPSSHTSRSIVRFMGEFVHRSLDTNKVYPLDKTPEQQPLANSFNRLAQSISSRLLADYMDYMHLFDFNVVFTQVRMHEQRSKTGYTIKGEHWRYLERRLPGGVIAMTANTSLFMAATVSITNQLAINPESDADVEEPNATPRPVGPEDKQHFDIQYAKVIKLLQLQSFLLDWQLRAVQQLMFGSLESIAAIFPGYNPLTSPFALDLLCCLNLLCTDSSKGIRFSAHVPIHGMIPDSPNLTKDLLKYLLSHCEKFGFRRSRFYCDAPLCYLDATHPRYKFEPIRYQNKSLYITTLVLYRCDAHSSHDNASLINYYAIVRIYDTESDRKRHQESVQRRIIEKQDVNFLTFEDWHERGTKWRRDIGIGNAVLEIKSKQREAIHRQVVARVERLLAEARACKDVANVWQSIVNRQALALEIRPPIEGVCPLDYFTHVCLDTVHPMVGQMLKLVTKPDQVLTFLQRQYPQHRLATTMDDLRLLILFPDTDQYLIQVSRHDSGILSLCSISALPRVSLQPEEHAFVRHVLESIASYLWSLCIHMN